MRSVKQALVAAALLLPGAAVAQMPKWQTPDGQIYFGTNPPPSSERVGEVEAAVASPDPARAVPDPAPPSVEEAPSSDAQESTSRELSERQKAAKAAWESSMAENPLGTMKHAYLDACREQGTKGEKTDWLLVEACSSSSFDREQ